MDAVVIPIQAGRKKPPKRNNTPMRIALIAAVLIILTVAFSVFWWITHRQAGSEEKDDTITYIGEIPVVTDFLPEDAAGRPGIKRDIKFIVIHETDNFRAGADAKAHNSFIQQNAQTEELSWHYTVDDHEIYHHLPDNEAAYHASDHLVENGGNLNGIGVEMCVNEDGDYEKTLDNAVQLTATLLKKYHLKLSAVKKHEDFSGKICPARLINEERWDEFVDRVHEAYDALDS